MKARLGGVILATIVGMAGCGGGDDENLDQFVGSWMYASGTSTVTCVGAAPQTSQLSGTFTISRGIDSPLAIVGSCTLKMDPKGNTATVRSGQACPPSVNGQVTETDTIQSGSFTVNGLTGTIAVSGSALLVGGGQSLTCTFTDNGTANKVSK
jgi:hypothetical protein